MTMATKRLGRAGEDLAAAYLEERDYRIAARNYRVPAGEIDIVAVKGRTVIFVEVKTRRSVRCGTPAQAVGWYKQQKIIRTAYWFLQQAGISECECRFDVMEVYAGEGEAWQVRHIPGAFEIQGRG